MKLQDITNILQGNKSTIIQVLFVLIYVGIIIFVAIKTITGGATTNTLFYKTLYLLILLFPPVFYIYRSGTGIPTSIEINSIGSAIKSAAYFLCFIGLIYGAIYLLGNFSFLVGWFSVVIGALIGIVSLALFYEAIKDIKIGERTSETGRDYIGWSAFLWKLLFYIPCLVIDFVRYINYQIGITPPAIWSLFVFEISLLLIYFYLPGFVAKLTIHDGKQIVSEPLYLNLRQEIASVAAIFPKLEEPQNVATISQLPNPYDVSGTMPEAAALISGEGTAIDQYGKETKVKCSDVFMKSGAGYAEINGCNLEIYDPTYVKGSVNGGNAAAPTEGAGAAAIRTYSIAAWVFINPQPTAVNSYSVPTNILRLGPYEIETAAQRTQGKPMLSYFNYVDKENGRAQGTYRIFLSNRDTKYYDIVAPEQKWNLFVFNYSNKIDVFLNGDLVISAAGLTPPTFSNTDAFIVGEDDGLDGAIRDVVFFPHTLTTQQIFNIEKGRKIGDF